MDTWEALLLTELEQLGEPEVRTRMLGGDFGAIESQRRSSVEAWLRSKELARRDA